MQVSERMEKVDKQLFDFVQKDEKIFDKKFETKPIGYFKDAMIRFGKNRTNVIATAVLFIMILLSIIIPTVTAKNFVELETRLAHLPPRIPVLENYGIFDGTKMLTTQEVDRSTIDPVTGLGLPFATVVRHEFILTDTLENYEMPCSAVQASCVGGIVRISLRETATSTVYETPDFISLSGNNHPNPTLTVNVANFSADHNPRINILLQPDFFSEHQIIATISEAGEHVINIREMLETPNNINSRLRIELEADAPGAFVELDSLEFLNEGESEPFLRFGGFGLSQLTRLSGASRVTRSEASVLMADFRYDAYAAAMGPWRRANFSADRYDELLATQGANCTRIDNPDNSNGWFFSEGCPIIEVIGRTEGVNVGGVDRFAYDLILDFSIFRGFEETPYYYFGTTGAGRDLFALTWVALRTSLLIGLVAAFINITVGVIYGAISGYYGGKVDILMERFSEVVARIPFLVVLAISVAYVGPGITTLIIVLIVSGWIGVASVTRTQFYRFKGREYVLASRTLGAKDSRLIFRHILPNGIGTIITASVLMIPLVIFTESTLSYLGFGIGHGQSFNVGPFEFSGVSIGVLLADGREEMLDKPYLTYFPAIIISILMITFNMFGNALRDAFNPSLRGSE
jgi:ABC-type dipeptide/oligopeptide/nickel transport system permease subunit